MRITRHCKTEHKPPRISMPWESMHTGLGLWGLSRFVLPHIWSFWCHWEVPDKYKAWGWEAGKLNCHGKAESRARDQVGGWIGQGLVSRSSIDITSFIARPPQHSTCLLISYPRAMLSLPPICKVLYDHPYPTLLHRKNRKQVRHMTTARNQCDSVQSRKECPR